jgi:hypothetical protein
LDYNNFFVSNFTHLDQDVKTNAVPYRYGSGSTYRVYFIAIGYRTVDTRHILYGTGTLYLYM